MKLFPFSFFIFILLFLIPTNTIHAQQGQWQWIKGVSHYYTIPGHYGVQGVPDPLNEPPALYEACEWTDLNGNFWIYGGNEVFDLFNDLWKYDPLTNEWTWMSGTATANDPGVYGVQGIPSPLNRPPSMGYAALTWTDSLGDLWIFGGYNSGGTMCDLWRYNIATNIWTWMKGSGLFYDPGVYGIRTIPNAANYPGHRNETNAAWTYNNNLWLFGGDVNGGGDANDLWRYDIGTNTWTWMKGSMISGQIGSQAAIGVEDSTNEPCGRYVTAHWKDINGNFWMFGGQAWDGVQHVLSDLWKYNPSTNNWTYMGGQNLLANFPDSSGTQCLLSNSNWPAPRFENRSVWTDKNGDFWMFGGGDWGDTIPRYTFSDLWKYCVSKNQWVWVNGSHNVNDTVSGQLGIYSPANTPGNRIGAVGFRYNDSLYLFGGYENSSALYADMWKYYIDYTCAPCQALQPDAQFIFTDSIYCEGVCVNFNNQSVNATSYQWYFPGGTPASDTSANPQNICYNIAGSYDVMLIASNSSGIDTIVVNNAVSYTPAINFSPIQQQEDTLISVPGYFSYQWFINGNLINGATDYFYVATQNGDYSVQVTDSNGCSATAFVLNVLTGIKNMYDAGNLLVTDYDDGIRITAEMPKRISCIIMLTDALGQMLFQKSFQLNSGRNEVEIPITLSAGNYFVVVRHDQGVVTKTIFIAGDGEK
jgi:hypothetical protein